MKILHLADLHLRDADIEEATRCGEFIVAKADEECPKLITIAGDIFDSQDIKLDTKAARLAIQFVSDLARIAPVVIVRGTPSHDGNSPEILSLAFGIGRVYVATKPTQLYLYDDNCLATVEEIDPVITDDVEAVITLVPTPTKQFFQGSEGTDIKTGDAEIAGAMATMFAGFGAMAAKYKVPHILIGHWNITGAYVSATQILTGVDIEISPDQMALAHADLCCMGHIHKPQPIGQNIFYSGSPWALNWGEEYRHGFFLHTLCDHSLLNSQFILTPATGLLRYNLDMTAGQKAAELIAPTGGPENAIVRIDINVFQDEVDLIDRPYLQDAFSWAKKVDIRINRIPRGNVRSETILIAERLRDKLTAKANMNGGGMVPESILRKADAIEGMEPEALVSAVGKGGAL